MKAKVIEIDQEHIDQAAIREAGGILLRGGLVAFPTETVYGLGGNAMDAAASGRIYAAKGRPSDNPLIVHIAEMDSLREIVSEVDPRALLLAEEYWPGPLTMILPKGDKVPYETTGGLDSVAVRMPSNPIALALIQAGGGFVAAPSANTSGRPSPTTAQHVIEDLGDTVEMVLDGGMVGIGIESTIVDFTEKVPTILRPGYISLEMLKRQIPEIRMDKGLIEEHSDLRPKAPGMKYKHYAPRAPLSIVEGCLEQVVDKINQLAAQAEANGQRVGIIGTDETVSLYTSGLVKSIGTREEEESIALHLYEVLREFDSLDVSCIYSESFDTPRMGQAIMNRLLKAAGHTIIYV